MNWRVFTRFKHIAKASIAFDNAVVLGQTGNMSLQGMFIATDNDIPLNKQVDITVDFNSPDQSSLKFNAEVVRKEANGVGIRINKLSAESFVRLRATLDKYTSDPGITLNETFNMLNCIY
jgi:hypothetical protein